MKNKKAISIIVSYAILVVIALSLGALVYQFIQNRIPAEDLRCPADVALIVTDLSCDTASSPQISFALENRGLFNVSGAFIRFGKPGQEALLQINSESSGPTFNPFIGTGGSQPLAPDKSTQIGTLGISTIYDSAGEYVLEIQPYVFQDRNLRVPCQGAIIRQPVTCPSS